MRKSCGKCIYGKPITLKDRLEGFKINGIIMIDKELIPNSSDKVICVLRKDIHKMNKEQRTCNDFDERK